MARTDAKSSSLRRRPSRSVPAAIVAILIAAAGAAGVWASTQRLANGAWPVWVGNTHRWLATHTWGSVMIIAISLAVAVIGLGLLLTALRPGMPNAYRIDTDDDGSAAIASTEFVMTRRSVAKLATAHAALVEGVDSVSASVTARRVVLNVKSASAQSEDIKALVTTAVSEALAAAGLSPQPAVSATVATVTP